MTQVSVIWDETTICFGNDCPNCERERMKMSYGKPTVNERLREALGTMYKELKATQRRLMLNEAVLTHLHKRLSLEVEIPPELMKPQPDHVAECHPEFTAEPAPKPEVH